MRRWSPGAGASRSALGRRSPWWSSTSAAASTTEKDLRGATGGNIDAAVRVGRAIAERALSNGIESVVFDRGGYRYHGRVKALADAAREAGLNKDELNSSAAEAAPEEQSAQAG